MPMPDGSVDSSYARFVLQHVPKPEDIFREPIPESPATERISEAMQGRVTALNGVKPFAWRVPDVVQCRGWMVVPHINGFSVCF